MEGQQITVKDQENFKKGLGWYLLSSEPAGNRPAGGCSIKL